MSFSENITKIYNKLKNTTGGKNADYIPELSRVNPRLYAISVHTIYGEQFDIGDYAHEFSIQSCSKIFTLALALETYGVKYIKDKIGSNKSREVFNSISAAETMPNHTINSFVNGGAIATTSLLYKPNKTQFIKRIVDNMSEYAGKNLHVGQKVYNSEKSASDHNLALAHLLKSYGRFYNDVHASVDVYTKQCSVMVTNRDVALMACTLANGGVNPKTGSKLINKTNVEYIIDHMKSSGLYEETEDWMKNVGLYAKSGVSGVLLIVIPGVMGISIFSPPLNAHGNSVKGIKTAKLISKLL